MNELMNWPHNARIRKTVGLKRFIGIAFFISMRSLKLIFLDEHTPHGVALKDGGDLGPQFGAVVNTPFGVYRFLHFFNSKVN